MYEKKKKKTQIMKTYANIKINWKYEKIQFKTLINGLIVL